MCRRTRVLTIRRQGCSAVRGPLERMARPMKMRRLVAIFGVLALVMLAGEVGPAAAAPGHGPGGSGLGSALVGSAPAGVGSSAVAFDAATETIYVANGNNANGPNAGGNTVSVIDGRRCNADDVHRCAGPWPTVTVGNEPSAITVDPATHTVYVTNIDDNTVSVIDGRTCNGRTSAGCGQAAATVPVGSMPIGIFADNSNHTVYVANFNNFNDGTVSMIDSATCNGIHPASCPTVPPPTVAVGDGPGDIDVNQQTHTAYVATLTGLTVFDNQNLQRDHADRVRPGRHLHAVHRLFRLVLGQGGSGEQHDLRRRRRHHRGRDRRERVQRRQPCRMRNGPLRYGHAPRPGIR